MDHHREQEQHLPADRKQTAKEGEKNRREMDSVPEPGTDPLHEGP
ncbi:MAG TPA: hypothetical protein VGD19_11175 [Allosphingosinicella sp.]|jgi:hypothetical protein